MDWKATTLGEICDLVGGIIQTGPFGSQLHQSDYSRDGIPIVMPKDIIEGRIATDGIARVNPEHVERLSRHKLKFGDIVYGRRGDIGRQALIRQPQTGWLCGTGCLRLSLGASVVKPSFLHYYLCEPDVIGWIANQAIGATLPNLNTRILRSVPIRLPPLPTQRKIAAILSAYDELIENNLRRIKILEEMAQNLYREWFVKFRFPGHEKSRFIDSSLGKIPEGWETAMIKDVADVNARSIRKEGAPSEIAYIDIASVTPGSIDKIEIMAFSDAPSRARRITRHGDIIWSSVRPNRRSFSLIVHPPVNLIVSTGFVVISAKKVPFTYLYQVTTTDDFVDYLVNHAKGSAYPAVNADDFENAGILVPSKQLLSSFDDKIIPIAIITNRLKAKNTTLRRTRDLLLPKLISGEVDVSDMEIKVTEENIVKRSDYTT